MIVDLLEQEGKIIAVNNIGDLYVWEVGPNCRTKTFKHNISILTSLCRLQIDASRGLTGLVELRKGEVLAYNHQSIYCVKLGLFQIGKKSGVTQLDVLRCLQTNQQINCLEKVSDTSILMGTSQGNLILFNTAEEKEQNRRSLAQKPEKQPIKTFNSSLLKKRTQITGIKMLKHGDAIVSDESGQLLAFNLQRFEVVADIIKQSGLAIEKINRLTLNERDEQVYSIHNNYIAAWLYKSFSCAGYFEYENCQGLAVQEGCLAVIGNHSVLTLLSDHEQSVPLSMRFAGVIKMVGKDLTAIGGSDNMIDLMLSNSRLMTLIPQ